MPDVLLFGATGYTGSLTAEALGRRGADFVVAGRSRAKLEALAARTGAAGIRVAEVGDVDALAAALADVKVMITCVGPFQQLGDTAAEAALRAGVHYVDSTGEGSFVNHLVDTYGGRAEEAGIVMAPALGFDEVPADVALSQAVEGLSRPDAVITYALPHRASTGTMRTIITNIATGDASWLRDGRRQRVATGARRRWAPMPAPLGPKLSLSFPFSIGELAPLHLDLNGLELYGVTSPLQAAALRLSMPVAKVTLGTKVVRAAAGKLLDLRADGPTPEERRSDRWMILAEARSAEGWRNVAVSGSDPYGLTAETLAAGAMKLATSGQEGAGVMAPVQAIGRDLLHKELIDLGVDVKVYEPV